MQGPQLIRELSVTKEDLADQADSDSDRGPGQGEGWLLSGRGLAGVRERPGGCQGEGWWVSGRGLVGVREQKKLD